MLDTYLDLLDLTYFEAGEAFKGLADHNVWKRPAEGLLSVGELAGHVAYWNAVRFAGEGGESGETDLTMCRIQSPLIDARFRYYPDTLATPPSDEHWAMTADKVCSEMMRIHKEASAELRSQNPDLDAPPPGWPAGGPSGNTLREFLKYQIFHVSYHAGQMYSVRHLLGEQTPDN